MLPAEECSMSPVNKRITILAVDHNPILLGGIVSLIENEADLHLVATAGNAADAIALFLSRSPRIVLMDLDLPDSSALSVIRKIKEYRAEVPIIGMATHEFDRTASAALAEGIRAVVSKERIYQDLIPVIHQACGLSTTGGLSDPSGSPD
jgi:DNA-binding NarL/FixJ family response regulator